MELSEVRLLLAIGALTCESECFCFCAPRLALFCFASKRAVCLAAGRVAATYLLGVSRLKPSLDDGRRLGLPVELLATLLPMLKFVYCVALSRLSWPPILSCRTEGCTARD